MNKTNPRTLPGFMELLPEEQILFNQIQDKIRKTYERFWRRCKLGLSQTSSL